MDGTQVKMPISELGLTVNIVLTGTRRFRFGLWLLKIFVGLAARIGGFGVLIERED